MKILTEPSLFGTHDCWLGWHCLPQKIINVYEFYDIIIQLENQNQCS